MNLNNKNSIDDFDKCNDKRHVDVRLDQRNGRKCITTIEGLEETDELKFKDLLSSLKKRFACTGSAKEEEGKIVIKLTGMQHENVKEYLVKKGFYEEEEITVHV